MRKNIIYLDNFENIDEIISIILSDFKEKSTIYIYIGEDIQNIFSEEKNFSDFSQKIKSLNYEIILVSKDFEIFQNASIFDIKIQNIIDENLDLSIGFKKIKIGNQRVSYSIKNFSNKINSIGVNSYINSKKEEIVNIYKGKKKIILGVFILSFFLIFIILIFIIPKSKVYIKPGSRQIEVNSNIIFVENIKENQKIIEESSKNIVRYKKYQKEYRKTLKYITNGKSFEGEFARGKVKIQNFLTEDFGIKKGTKFQTEDGLIFLSNYYISIPGGKNILVNGKKIFKPGESELDLKAGTEDLFSQIIGERGNIKKGTKFKIIGLTEYMRRFVGIESGTDFSGGTSKWRKFVQEQDIKMAKEKFKLDALEIAKDDINEIIKQKNSEESTDYILLPSSKTINVEIKSLEIPKDIIGKKIDEFEINGIILIKGIGYDKNGLLKVMEKNLNSKIDPNMKISHIDFSDIKFGTTEFVQDVKGGIKSTISISGREDFDLFGENDFSKKYIEELRSNLVNMDYEDGKSYLYNQKEISDIQIELWPPFLKKFPKIDSNIEILPYEEKIEMN